MDKVEQAFKDLLIVAKEQYGVAMFKYRRVHHRYNSRAKTHMVSCIDHPEVTREEYLKGVAEGKNKSSKAFYGNLRCSYDDYRQEISKPGYLQKISKMISEEIKKEALAPEDKSGSAETIPNKAQAETE